MDRIITLVLKTALMLAATGSVLALLRMILAQFLPIYYYWWGAVAFVGATLVLAAAIRLRDIAPLPRESSKPAAPN
jgi:hypothetical protein